MEPTTRSARLAVFALALALVLGLALPMAAQAGGNKIDVCHIPPGNPANWHTINVSVNAWPAHEAHGDYMMACHEVTCEDLCSDGDARTQDVASDYDECICNTDPRPPVNCDDTNPCTQDSCDALLGCEYDSAPMTGVPCGVEGTCESGICVEPQPEPEPACMELDPGAACSASCNGDVVGEASDCDAGAGEVCCLEAPLPSCQDLADETTASDPFGGTWLVDSCGASCDGLNAGPSSDCPSQNCCLIPFVGTPF